MGLSGQWNGSALTPGDPRSPLKWGTGASATIANPMSGYGRDVLEYAPDEAPLPDSILPGQQDAINPSDDPYIGLAEDSPSSLYGYGPQTGTSLRPSLSQQSDSASTNGPNGVFPPYTDGGEALRATDRGAIATNTAKKTLPDDAAMSGWMNKINGDVLDSQPPDDSQLVILTSQVQRDKVRGPSQRGQGSASTYSAPIRSRIVGMKEKIYSTGHRLAEMYPRQQGPLVIRGWSGRTAGTGDPTDMYPNEMYASAPMMRTPVPPPNQGPAIAGNSDVISNQWGYTSEDMSW